jgi:hypothetical protein
LNRLFINNMICAYAQRQTLGLAESIGDALASGCTAYVVAGSMCLVILSLTWITFMLIVIDGVLDERAVFKPVGKTFLQRVRAALSSRGETMVGSMKAKMSALSAAKESGEWTDARQGERVCKAKV